MPDDIQSREGLKKLCWIKELINIWAAKSLGYKDKKFNCTTASANDLITSLDNLHKIQYSCACSTPVHVETYCIFALKSKLFENIYAWKMKKLQTWLFNCLSIFNSNSRLNSGSSVAVLNTSSLLLLYENMKVRFYGQVISLRTNNFKKSSPKSYINSDMEPNSIRFFLFNFFLNWKNLQLVQKLWELLFAFYQEDFNLT